MDAQLTYVRDELEKIKRIAQNGAEYWQARDIAAILDYKEWRNFADVIEKAKNACEMSGNFIAEHFVSFTDKVAGGSGAQLERENWFLSKYACHLIAMNGDPRKPEIAVAQTYFAFQTQRQEQQDLLTEEERRVLLRNRVKDANRKLSGAAKEAGVRSQMFGVFHDAGYKGLYGGMGLAAIKSRKGLGDKDDLLDCIGRAELAANEFRVTQTEEKLRIQQIKGEQSAIETHKIVGSEFAKRSRILEERSLNISLRSHQLKSSRQPKRRNQRNWVQAMQVEKEQFDALLQKMLQQKPEKTSAIKGKPGNLEPIIPAPKTSAPR